MLSRGRLRADQSWLYASENVSPFDGSPELMPFFSHLLRCAEVPWLNESGTVYP